MLHSNPVHLGIMGVAVRFIWQVQGWPDVIKTVKSKRQAEKKEGYTLKLLSLGEESAVTFLMVEFNVHKLSFDRITDLEAPL